MSRPVSRGYLVAAIGVFAVSLALYVPTLLPDVATWDTAEFQTIGPVLGIAHPTGYPSYTLLAWLASVLLQPFGNEAYRADLLSALLMAGAAALAAVATIQITRRWPLGIVAGLVFAVTPIGWRVATRADAHALHVFLAALLLVLVVEWGRRQRSGDGRHAGRWLIAAAIVYGLSLGNHALTLLLAPGIAAFVLLVAPRILWQQWRLVLGCFAATLTVTVAVYAYLPVRSAMDPPLDYADPETWESFWYVVLGQQFQGMFRPLAPFLDIVSSVWDELVRNLGLVAILVPAGAVLGAIRHPRVMALTGLWFVCSWVFALGYANASIERYYLVPLLAAAIWVALAAEVVWEALHRAVPTSKATPVASVPLRWSRGGGARTWLVAGLVAVLLGLALLPVPGRRGAMDTAGETFGRRWLEATFAALEPDAAVISWWSYSTPLWYGRWVEGRREDIVIVDDRDVLDDGFGRAENAIDHFLPLRPVYVIRRDQDLPALAQRYVLERVGSVPDPGALYRVIGPRGMASAQPA